VVAVNGEAIDHILRVPALTAFSRITPGLIASRRHVDLLTSKEHQALRKADRRQAEEDRQRRIALGLAPPPQPRMTMASLVRVMSAQAVANPTKLAEELRQTTEARVREHEERNAAAARTADERATREAARAKQEHIVRDEGATVLGVALWSGGQCSDAIRARAKVEGVAADFGATGLLLYVDPSAQRADSLARAWEEDDLDDGAQEMPAAPLSDGLPAAPLQIADQSATVPAAASPALLLFEGGPKAARALRRAFASDALLPAQPMLFSSTLSARRRFARFLTAPLRSDAEIVSFLGPKGLSAYWPTAGALLSLR
jgi:hypothetical protein